MKIKIVVAAILLLLGAQRLPAPIQEEKPSPTAAPEQAKTRSTKQPRSSSQSKNQANASRNPFDGTWAGTFKAVPFVGDVELIVTITGRGTAISMLYTKNGARFDSKGTCDGITTRWTAPHNCAWTFTPSPDGKTAIATDSCPGLIPYKTRPTVFRRVSR